MSQKFSLRVSWDRSGVPSSVLTCGGGGSSAAVGVKFVVDVELVKAVLSSRLVRTVSVVRIRLCTLSECEAMAVDMTNPSDWSKYVCGSIDL